MANEFGDHQYWAIILGGSSGLGLAAARKLAAHGMNLCIVHRDPGVEMERVNAAFDELRASGVQVITFNADVTRADKRAHILETLQTIIGTQSTAPISDALQTTFGTQSITPISEPLQTTMNAQSTAPISDTLQNTMSAQSTTPISDTLQTTRNAQSATPISETSALKEANQSPQFPQVQDAVQSTNGPKGKIRCLLHSIARGTLKAMLPDTGTALSIDDYRITLDSMAYSLYEWVKDLSDKQLFATDARVLSFTSEGSHRAWKHYGAVSAAKAALEAISRNISLEFAPRGIRANCIQAGTTNTRSLQLIPGSDQLIAWSEARNPFQRLTTPEDVANVVYLLCKDEAAWINGAIIPVDGGAHIC